MDACDVTLYALSTCIHCINCKTFLNGCGVKYDCIYVDRLEGEEKKIVLEKIREINPMCSFPTLIIGDKVIVGFREDKIRECLDL
ncbi:MAG TPA: glutaredoxin family protein [Deltaproteobacteria bacterium]|nr:glutaredoxin family protein [Deltaproteobacteria bacterium]